MTRNKPEKATCLVFLQEREITYHEISYEEFEAVMNREKFELYEAAASEGEPEELAEFIGHIWRNN